ncbi:MAG: phage major capsid protein [Lautropia sp.]
MTYGVSGIPSEGPTADDVNADIKALFDTFTNANNDPTTAVWIMPSRVAMALSLMKNALGQREFAGMSLTGGKLNEVPVIASEYVPTTSAGSMVILANASDIYLGDEGEVQVDLSREASVQMDSAPDDPVSASTVMVSLWQHNLVGFRAERTINWAKRRASAVAYLTGVNWGAPT